MNAYSSLIPLCLLLACLGFWPASNPSLQAQIAASVISIPAPFGGDLGQIGGGLAFQSRTRNTASGWLPDANAAVAFGLGDSEKWAGVGINLNIFGLSNDVGEDNNFGSGTLDVQLNRKINDYIYIGAGVRSLANWKPPKEAIPPRNNRSFYVCSNFIIPIHRRYDEPFSLLFVNAGIGNGIYRTLSDFDPNTSGQFNWFGSIGLQLLRGTNAIVEWNGSGLNAGLSIYPFKKLPYLGGILALADLTYEGESPRVIGSVAYFIDLSR